MEFRRYGVGVAVSGDVSSCLVACVRGEEEGDRIRVGGGELRHGCCDRYFVHSLLDGPGAGSEEFGDFEFCDLCESFLIHFAEGGAACYVACFAG